MNLPIRTEFNVFAKNLHCTVHKMPPIQMSFRKTFSKTKLVDTDLQEKMLILEVSLKKKLPFERFLSLY